MKVYLCQRAWKVISSSSSIVRTAWRGLWPLAVSLSSALRTSAASAQRCCSDSFTSAALPISPRTTNKRSFHAVIKDSRSRRASSSETNTTLLHFSFRLSSDSQTSPLTWHLLLVTFYRILEGSCNKLNSRNELEQVSFCFEIIRDTYFGPSF